MSTVKFEIKTVYRRVQKSNVGHSNGEKHPHRKVSGAFKSILLFHEASKSLLLLKRVLLD